MRTNLNNNRLSGLIAVLELLALLVGLIVIILLPNIRYTSWLFLFLGVILLAIAFIMDFRRVRGAVTGKRGKFGTGTTVMVERIYPESCNPGHFKRKVTLEELFVIFALLVVHDFIDQRMDLFVIQRWQVDAANITINPNHGWKAGREMQVGCTLLFAECQ